MLATPGQLLVNEALPPDLRDYSRTLGQDEINSLLGQLAREHPEQYRKVCWRLVQLGRNAAFDEGSTITLNDLVPVVDKRPLLDEVKRQEKAIRSDRRLTDEQKDDAIETLYGEATKRLTEETYKNALANNNPFAIQAKYKARGNKSQLGAMLTSPGTYTDSNGKLVPIFIGSAYSEGLKPHEYWAASYGARLGVTCLTPDTKIVMADWSEREIGGVRPGDMVMGARSDGTIYPVRVKHFFDNGVQPVYRWTFRCASSQAITEVKATAEHKLLARTRKWGSGGRCDQLSHAHLVRLGDAKFGRRPDHNSYFAQVSAGGHFVGRHVDTALLIGLMTGDGCCSDRTSTNMSFSCADPLLLDDIRGYLSGLNLKLRLTSAPYTHSFSRIAKLAHEWYYAEDGHKFNNRARYDVWRYIGGCHSWDKVLPHDIMSWDDESVVAYLAGLFATDGSFYMTQHDTPYFSLALNSLSIVSGVKRILELRFGVWCSPVHDMQRKREHHMYGIQVSHPDSYNRLVALVGDVMPGVKRRRLVRFGGRVGTIGRTPAIGFRIQSKEFLGDQHVVDIEVDSPDHMFLLANGIISSNSTKLGTQKGGYLSKAMNSAAIEQVVTEDDCGTKAGMPVDVNDDDSIGAVLQEDVAGFKPGTVITKPVLDKIRATKVDEIVVRSPITCGCKNGLCKRCVGMRETGRFPDIGYNVGINAASALGEQIAQNSLNCLVEGTLVRMADGSSKPIEDIRPGEYVLGSDMHGNLAPTRVVDRYDNGFQPCVDTKFIVNGTRRKSAGIHLLSTTEHPILGARFVSGRKDAAFNWVPRMLKVGMKSKHFYAYGPSSFDDTGYRYEPLAMLLGALVGDGCYTRSVSGVHLSCADESEVQALNKSIAGSGVRLDKLRYRDGIYYMVAASRANADRRGNPVKNYLIKHGMYGKYAHDKDVPTDIWGWDNASVAAFIGGFVAAGGSVYSSDKNGKPGVSVASTSTVLLGHLRDLLLVRFGVMTSELTVTGRAGTGNYTHDQYQFTITKAAAVRRFAQAITIPGAKQQRLSDMVAAYGGGKRESVMAFVRVAQTPIGIRHVYDLEVACDDHIYLLENGLIVHNTKHSGKRSDLGAYVGFDPLKNLATMPAEYDSKASVATSDGTVKAIVDAPQGGQYVELDDGDRVYVPPSLKPTVKVGDILEAGDAVSSGLVSPADVVAYKGVGEGRRYFANRFTKVFRDSHYGVNRRNVEVVARALVNNVKVDSPDSEGDALPGDVVRYSAWASGYQPRAGAEELPLAKSVGRYLERPVLHYTIGTRVTPNVVKSLKKHKVESLLTNTSAPGVEPYAVGVVEAPAYSGDWMARLGTSYLKDRLLEDAQRGGHSELHGVNPIPGMAKGVELGRDMSTKGEY